MGRCDGGASRAGIHRRGLQNPAKGRISLPSKADSRQQYDRQQRSEYSSGLIMRNYTDPRSLQSGSTRMFACDAELPLPLRIGNITAATAEIASINSVQPRSLLYPISASTPPFASMTAVTQNSQTKDTKKTHRIALRPTHTRHVAPPLCSHAMPGSTMALTKI